MPEPPGTTPARRGGPTGDVLKARRRERASDLLLDLLHLILQTPAVLWTRLIHPRRTDR